MKPVVFAFALAAMAACAPTSGSGPSTTFAGDQGARQCFPLASVNGFRAVDARTVNVRVGASDVYQLDLFSPCHDINFTEGVAVRARGGGTSFVCNPLELDVIVPTPIGPRTCSVTAMHKLSPSELSALEPKYRP